MVFGFIAVVAAAALARGVVGATTTGGRVAVAAIFGTLLIGTVVAWVLLGRNPLELQISDDRIVLVPSTGRQVHEPLWRGGGPVELIRRAAQSSTWTLHQPATGRLLLLDLFDINAVRATLAERGWRPPPQS